MFVLSDRAQRPNAAADRWGLSWRQAAGGCNVGWVRWHEGGRTWGRRDLQGGGYGFRLGPSLGCGRPVCTPFATAPRALAPGPLGARPLATETWSRGPAALACICGCVPVGSVLGASWGSWAAALCWAVGSDPVKQFIFQWGLFVQLLMRQLRSVKQQLPWKTSRRRNSPLPFSATAQTTNSPAHTATHRPTTQPGPKLKPRMPHSIVEHTHTHTSKRPNTRTMQHGCGPLMFICSESPRGKQRSCPGQRTTPFTSVGPCLGTVGVPLVRNR